MNSDLNEKREALHGLRSMLRRGAAHGDAPMVDHGLGEESSEHEAHETAGEEASEHESPSVKSANRSAIPENVKPGDMVPNQWSEGDKGHGASEVRAREDGMSRSAVPARGNGSPPPGRMAQPSPTEQQKPGNHGPGWAESDGGHGPSELRARADGATRSAEGEDGDESPTAGLVAGLVHVAKKYRAP